MTTPFGNFILTDLVVDRGELKSVTLTLRSTGPVDLKAVAALVGQMYEVGGDGPNLVFSS